MVITAKVGLFTWLLAVTLAAAVPITCAIYSSSPPRPREVGPCVDSMEVRGPSEGRYSCAPGSRLEAYPMSMGQHLVKCVCPPARLPAPGAPDAASGGD